jgi:hypothetical protein
MIFISSCDWQAKIALIKNNNKDTISCLIWDKQPLTDSLLYYDKVYIKDWIPPDSSGTITLPNRQLKKAPDSVKTYIYVFDVDSINKYRKMNPSKGILKHSLLKKIIIQLNKVKEPLDTIYAAR